MTKHYTNYYRITAKRNSNHDCLEFNVLARTFKVALKEAIIACKQHDHYLVSIQQDTFYKLSRQLKPLTFLAFCDKTIN
jgi:hypothetical protein